MTQQLARAFEKGITEHPYDWHMLQRVFTADLDPARLAARAPAGGAPSGTGPETGGPEIRGAEAGGPESGMGAGL
jgi:KDO2-lipid IV(A) lauroyltransferase